ncbi:toxin-antitoxin system YwqK family antitoxin [Sphingobacterium multivorum]|uniref:MORN repeat variant n=1 Tax=Sphingobacterium multivorum TaxID=28454 RepID=A0A2X2J1U2_SPHMU|nr:hypothetical protein [Sphingobacterium multivorum]QRQ61135.1 hypothetical protein I6J33_24055 [Sphingobacterium multivorum]SPZ88337.1 MORN repeat variant [Sphingobacterium multivorum]
MTTKKILYTIFFFMISIICQAQVKELAIFRRFTISSNDGSKTICYADNIKISPNSDKTYVWYESNQLHQTMGGYSGKLLNGQFTHYFPNKNLSDQGLYVKGLKQGVWRHWYPNGNLKSESQWMANIEEGTFVRYDEQGNWIQRGYLKEGKLHGSIENKTSDVISYQYFDLGKEISKEAFQNNNIFRKTGKLIGDQINQWFKKKENQPEPVTP